MPESRTRPHKARPRCQSQFVKARALMRTRPMQTAIDPGGCNRGAAPVRGGAGWIVPHLARALPLAGGGGQAPPEIEGQI